VYLTVVCTSYVCVSEPADLDDEDDDEPVICVRKKVTYCQLCILVFYYCAYYSFDCFDYIIVLTVTILHGVRFRSAI